MKRQTQQQPKEKMEQLEWCGNEHHTHTRTHTHTHTHTCCGKEAPSDDTRTPASLHGGRWRLERCTGANAGRVCCCAWLRRCSTLTRRVDCGACTRAPATRHPGSVCTAPPVGLRVVCLRFRCACCWPRLPVALHTAAAAAVVLVLRVVCAACCALFGAGTGAGLALQPVLAMQRVLARAGGVVAAGWRTRCLHTRKVRVLRINFHLFIIVLLSLA